MLLLLLFLSFDTGLFCDQNADGHRH
jgi:hypothetical protein